MRIFSLVFSIALVCTASATSNTQPGNNNYGTTYGFGRSCKVIGDHYNGFFIEACRQGQGTWMQLEVRYRNWDLIGNSRSPKALSAYIKLNGRDGLFPLGYDQNRQLAEVELSSIDPVAGDLFFYAGNQTGFNSWDLELAFVNSSDQWDSRYGQNYQFHIE